MRRFYFEICGKLISNYFFFQRKTNLLIRPNLDGSLVCLKTGEKNERERERVQEKYHNSNTEIQCKILYRIPRHADFINNS